MDLSASFLLVDVCSTWTTAHPSLAAQKLCASSCNSAFCTSRSAYNDILLKWDPATHTTQENLTIPKDLLSHDIIESSVMNTMLGECTYCDCPKSHIPDSCGDFECILSVFV